MILELSYHVAVVGRIRELRDVVRVLTGDLVGAAQQVQELNATRDSLVALQQKLTVILYVSQVLAALKLPSQFAKAVTKEVTYLHRILSQTLLKSDVQAIFRQVVQIFHSHITEAFSKLEVNTPQAKNRAETIPNYGLLDEFLAEKFGTKVDE
ncbi:hypothetical protein ABZP36_004147 [Zizania latifolia]